MQPLKKTLRTKLEHTIKEARDISEDAARAALEQLGIGQANPYPYLNENERNLRKKLRAHSRQLGDNRKEDGQQEIDRLVEEVAYEHWHRMLFARFLAENNLLIFPDPVQPIPISLEECEDLAAGEGARNGWELAARFATKMLPQIFRPDSPVFQLSLPPEHQRKLERLLAELPAEVFSASDSLGWVYQFWQAKKKDEINASEVKIGARELPVVTQLFTEPYMVSFLLDNSLGAWWAARRLSEDDLKNAQSEEELRRKASLPGVSLDYLRFVRGEDGRWAPAAGTFDGWPEHLSKFKALDPCTGSGHFLVAALPMLASMRMEREKLSAQEAVDAVLRDNLHGLEIDPRCVELAAFALAFSAWRYPEAGGYRMLPELNLACSGLSISAKKEEWLELASEDTNLQIVLDDIYDQFENAPVLGSLINPKIGLSKGNLLGLKWKDIEPLLAKVLSREQDDEKKERGVVAQGIVKNAMLLAGKYQCVITNVPYLVRGSQSDVLRDYCERHYKDAKNDLATVFLNRCLEFCADGGTTSNVLPQNWLFQKSYRKLRELLLEKTIWRIIAWLGPGAFESISGEVVKAVLVILKQENPARNPLGSKAESLNAHIISGLDVSEFRITAEKAAQLRIAEIKQVKQAKQLDNPDAIVSLDSLQKHNLSKDILNSYHGLTTGDLNRFVLCFWEVPLRTGYQNYQNPPTPGNADSGREHVVKNISNSEYKSIMGFRPDGTAAHGQEGIGISTVGAIYATKYSGDIFDQTITALIPKFKSDIPALWEFFSQDNIDQIIRKYDQCLKVTNKSFEKIPIDIFHWEKIAAKKYPNGLPKPYSDDPTQWIFHGHPAQSDAPLQVSVARLLGYRWPAERDPQMEQSDEARAWMEKCDELLSFADNDGIVCIPPVRGESAASDYLRNLLAAAYGPEWSTDKLSELMKQADHAGKSLESWLRDKFFPQHCKLFHHRPFIWHIWDGLNDGFAALINYHKLDSKLLESLIYTYLGDWISRQKDDIKNGVDGATEKLVAAENLKKRLEMILEGEKPYDIFVRWKPLEKQPIGWDPDLNDGVRLNIRPFMSVPDVGRKSAGVLRERPNINWNKDRGKDTENAPWYHRFGGDRINDYHLSLEEKREAQRA